MTETRARLDAVEVAAVVALFALGVALRCWRLDLGWFGVDQARDIQTALDIAAGRDWPTVGPTMRRVTSLGALYYYVWAVPALLSNDPLAAYRFAAGLGIATLVGVWWLARRWWGTHAALVALAVIATSRVAVIDTRIAWAPAALPAMGVLLLWLLTRPPTPWRLGALGAALGVAVQLHLAMAAWVVAAALLVAVRRPAARALGAALLGFIVAGFPAAYAALANAGADAGLATLPTRGPLPNVFARLWSVALLEVRVPAAFWQWPDTPEPWSVVSRGAALVVTGVVGLGLGRLVTTRARAWPEAVLLTVIACQLGMVVLLPGEAWYYYLDALLPVGALAAGALVAPWNNALVAPRSNVPGAARADALVVPTAAASARARTAVTAIVVAASLVSALQSARWIAATAHHGYVTLQPAALALDGAGGRDAAVAGRLLAAGVKRDVAAILAPEPAAFATRWRSVHGPAFDDATGDNGFWLSHASFETSSSDATASSPATPGRHAALWYRDDPTAPTAATPGFELVDVGPLRMARYGPAIAYETCRDANGSIVVPIRLVPAPRSYGDGTTARPPALPRRIDCTLAPGRGGVRVVAAVSAGTITLRDAAGMRSPSGQTASLCVARDAFTIDLTLPPDARSDLDLYERPDPDCAAGKIAP